MSSASGGRTPLTARTDRLVRALQAAWFSYHQVPPRVPALALTAAADHTDRMRRVCVNAAVSGMRAAYDEFFNQRLGASWSVAQRPGQSGDRRIGPDFAALEAHADYLASVADLLARPYRLIAEDGEDLPTRANLSPGSFVYRADPLDGSTNLSTTDENCASVSIVYERTHGDPMFLAAAIATSHEVFSVDRLGTVWTARTDGSILVERRVDRLSGHGPGALALHASTPALTSTLLLLCRGLELPRTYNVGGTPKVGGLLQGSLDLACNINACPDYDAVHYAMVLARGGFVARIDNGDFFSFESFIRLLETQDVDNAHAKIIPKCVAAKRRDLCERALDVLEKEPPDEPPRLDDKRRAS